MEMDFKRYKDPRKTLNVGLPKCTCGKLWKDAIVEAGELGEKLRHVCECGRFSNKEGGKYKYVGEKRFVEVTIKWVNGKMEIEKWGSTKLNKTNNESFIHRRYSRKK